MDDLENITDLHRFHAQELARLLKDCIWKPVSINVTDDFLEKVYKKTGEIPPYKGILNPVRPNSVFIYPWFNTEDKMILVQEMEGIARVGSEMIRVEGLSPKERLSNYYNRATAPGRQGLEIPFAKLDIVVPTNIP